VPAHASSRCAACLRLEQPQRLATSQQLLQQQSLSTASEQTGADIAKHGVVEHRVGQLEAQETLPIDPGADCLSGPAVGEVLTELQDGDQGQPPWRERGLASAGIKVGEVGIGEEGTELGPGTK